MGFFKRFKIWIFQLMKNGIDNKRIIQFNIIFVLLLSELQASVNGCDTVNVNKNYKSDSCDVIKQNCLGNISVLNYNDNVVKFVYKENAVVNYNQARFYAISMLASLMTALILFYFFFKQKRKIHIQTEAALADRTKLISMLSHDLLGPLSALDQATMLVNKKITEGDHNALVMYFNQYSKNIANLHHLASNILNYYTEKSLFQSVPSGIYSTLLGVNQFVAPFAAHKNVRIESIDHTYRLELMTSKGEALAVIMRNIIFNILHHTNANYIKLELWYDYNKLRISISDNADKMSDHVYQKIVYILNNFHSANKLDSRGMGLYLIGRYLYEINAQIEIKRSNTGNTYLINVNNVVYYNDLKT